jgi:hypothetical protein
MYSTSTTILTQVPTIHKHAGEHEAPPRDNFYLPARLLYLIFSCVIKQVLTNMKATL